MYNSGLRGKRAPDGFGTITTSDKFTQEQFPIPNISHWEITDALMINALDDTALDIAGGQTVVIHGGGFKPGLIVSINGSNVGTVELIDETRIKIISPALASGNYTIFISNTNGATAIYLPGLEYSGLPTWQSPAANSSIGLFYETGSVSQAFAASGDSSISYTKHSGDLPDGITLFSNGQLTGALPVLPSQTGPVTYSFTIKATDAQLQDSYRSFNLTVDIDRINWTGPANNYTVSSYEYTAIPTTTLQATSATGKTVSYAGSNVPAGVSLNSSTGAITGMIESVGSINSVFTATSAVTNRSAYRNITFQVNPDEVTWTTPSPASTINSYEYTDIPTVNLSASSVAGKTVSYSSSNLPVGLTLDGNQITGTLNVVGTANATLTATAATTNRIANNDVTFQVNPDVVTWSSPASDVEYDLPVNTEMADLSLSATSAAGKSVSYSADSLPIGLILSNNAISGTPTEVGTASTTLTATSSITNRSAIRYITWNVILTGDPIWKNTTMLLNASTSSIAFDSDASINDAQLTVVGNTSPNIFSPYQGNGYYGVSHSATPDYLSVAHNANFSLTSGQTDTFIIEGWFNFNAVTANAVLFDKSGTNSVSFANWAIYLNASKQIQLQWGVSGTPGNSNIGTLPSTFVPVTGTWYHIVFVKSNADWAVFANGSRIITYNGLNTAGDGNPTSLKIGHGIQGAANGAYFNGYISNVRAWRGTSGAPYLATSSTLTVPTSPLTAIPGTTLLTHQSARFVDNSSAGAIVTATGANIKVSSVSPFDRPSISSGSTYFDGTGDYLSLTTNTLGTNQFTVEAWVYLTSNSNYSAVYTSWPSTAASIGILLGFLNTGVLYGGIGNGSAADTITGASAVATNTWHHVAITRNASNLVTLWLNGVSVGTVTSTKNVNSTIANIGKYYTSTLQYYLFGYVSNLRVTDSTALYTSNFTPIATPLEATANTNLLTCQYSGSVNNTTLIDQSSYNNSIVSNGNIATGTFSPYSQTGWSTYFNGSPDGFTIPGGVIFGAGAFTAETWFNSNSFATVLPIFGAGASGTTNRLHVRIASSTSIVVYGMTSTSTFTVPTLKTNEWYHLAVVRDSSNNLTVFINGVRSSTGAVTNAGNMTSATTSIGWQSTTFFTGYLSNVRMVVGSAMYDPMQSSFAVPNAQLTAVENTKLLTCQSNRLVDNSAVPYTLTILGTPATQAYGPFNNIPSVDRSSSIYFDGAADYATVANAPALALGSSNFTIEFWVYPQRLTGVQGLVSKRDSGYAPFLIQFETAVLKMLFSTSGGNWEGIITATSSPKINAWSHVAIVRNANTVTYYLNGVSAGTVALTGSLAVTTASICVGSSTTGGGDPFMGFISDLRISSGSALYTAAFTPPFEPLASIGSTVLFLSGNSSAIVDSHSSNNLETAGNVTHSSESPFSKAYSSIQLSTGGDRFYKTGANISLNADFTVEFWIRPTAYAAAVQAVSNAYNNQSLKITASAGQGRLSFFNGTTYIYSDYLIPLNAWTHVVWERAGTISRAYINGVGQTAVTNMTATVAWTNVYVGTSNGNEQLFGYMSNLRVIKGQSLYDITQPTINVPTDPLTAVSGTVLLACQSNKFVDSTGNITFTTVGVKSRSLNPFIATSDKSMYFDGDGDYLQVVNGSRSINFGTDDFTIELWTYFEANNANYNPFIRVNGGGQLDFGVDLSVNQIKYSTSVAVISTTWAPEVGRWYHLTLKRTAGQAAVYVDGVQLGSSVTDAYNHNCATSASYRIGASDYSAAHIFKGYMKDFRITKGVARTVAVPTSSYSAK